MPKSKSMCDGCRDDYYNQTRTEGCWSYQSATVVTKVAVGTFQNPPYFWSPQTFLSCYHREGQHQLGRDDCRVVGSTKQAEQWKRLHASRVVEQAVAEEGKADETQ